MLCLSSGNNKSTTVEVHVGHRVLVRHTNLRKMDIEVVAILQQLENLEAIFLIARAQTEQETELFVVDGTQITSTKVNYTLN